MAAQRDDTHYALGLGAQPRAAAPDGHRPGSPRADGTGRRLPRLRGGVRGRRLQLRRHRLPVRGPEHQEGQEDPHHRRRAGRLPDHDQGRLRLRLRRHGQAHARSCKMDTLGHDFIPPGIHAGGLRYHGMAPMVSHCLPTRPHRGRVGHADRRLLGRRQLRPVGGHHPGPREQPRHRRGAGSSPRSASSPATRRPSSST